METPDRSTSDAVRTAGPMFMRKCQPARCCAVLSVLCGLIALCACKGKLTPTPDAAALEPSQMHHASTVYELGPLLAPCLAKNSLLSSAIKIAKAADGRTVILKRCISEDHDRVCIDRVLRQTVLHFSPPVSIVVSVGDAGSAIAVPVTEALHGEVFGGGAHWDDCKELNEWQLH